MNTSVSEIILLHTIFIQKMCQISRIGSAYYAWLKLADTSVPLKCLPLNVIFYNIFIHWVPSICIIFEVKSRIPEDNLKKHVKPLFSVLVIEVTCIQIVQSQLSFT